MDICPYIVHYESCVSIVVHVIVNCTMDDIKGVLNLYRGQLYVFPRAHEVSYKQYTHRCPYAMVQVMLVTMNTVWVG